MIALAFALVAGLVGYFAPLGYWPGVAYVVALPLLYRLDTRLLWVYFLAIMRLQMVRDAGRLPAEAVPLARRELATGLVLDFVYNWTWAVLIYRDIPRELLVTQRLERYMYGKAYRIQWKGWRPEAVRADIPPATGWRLEKTQWFAAVMLDPYDQDPSGHLRP